MQPLALQTATPNTDAGDSSGQSATSAKSADAPAFTDVLAAVQPPQTSDAATTSPSDATAAPEQAEAKAQADSDTADAGIAALAAASQIATRGVTLKAAPANETQLEITTLKIVTADGDAKAKLKTDATGDKVVDDADAASQAAPTTPLTDPAGLPVHSLIELAVAASMTPKDIEHTTSHADAPTEDGQTAAAVDAAAQPGEPSPQPTDGGTKDAVDLLTQVAATTTPTTPPDANVKTTAATAPKGPEVSALRSVSWFKTPDVEQAHAAKKKHVDADPTGDANTDEQQAATAELLKVDDQTAAPAPLPAPTSSSEPAPAQDAAAQAQVIANAVNAAPVVSHDARGEVSDLPEASPELVATQAQKISADQAVADKRANNTAPSAKFAANGGATIQSGDDIRSVAQSDTDGPATTDRSVATSGPILSDALVESKAPSTIRGLAQSNPETTFQVARPSEQVAPAETFTVEETAPNKTSPQTVEARQLEIAQDKSRESVKESEPTQPAAKADVNIREILKLGAADVTLTVQPQMSQQEAQQEIAQSTPASGAQSSTLTPQQAAPIATSNVETNGERRTIADDIRLRALERMVVNAVRTGTQILTIQLYPPGLGQVVLRMAMDGQRLRLSTRAATTEGADALRNMEVDLRDALAGNGVHLAGFDVSEDGTNDEAPSKKQEAPNVKPSKSGTNESFTVDMNA